MPPKNRGGESKQGLIIALVLSILVAVGLCVAAYYGFSEQDTLRAQAAEAGKKLNTMTTDRDWYRFQSQLYRAYMGQTQNIDLAELQLNKDKFDQGTLGTGQKDLADAQAVKAAVEKRSPWDPVKKGPKRSYEEMLRDRAVEIEALTTKNATLEKSVVAAEQRAKDAEDKLDAAQKDFKDALAKVSKTTDEEKRQAQDKIKELFAVNRTLSDDKEKETRRADDTQKKLDTELRKAKRLDEEVRTQKATISDQERSLDEKNTALSAIKQETGVDSKALEAKVLDAKALELLRNWREDWRIVRVSTQGDIVYINLGSADNVKPQLSFSIHAPGRDGRPEPTVKGTLEVLNVIGDHLSRARLTSVRDPNASPVVSEDLLFNPSWNPRQKTHVAIAGIVDLTGDGRDSVDELRRQLERQNVVVDAWQDPTDFSVKGNGITADTKYLIIGDSPDPSAPGARGRGSDIQAKVDAGIRDMKQKANQNNVTTIGLRRYMDMIGYRLPASVRERSND